MRSACSLLLLILASCAANGIWYKPNSSQEELSKVKYLCLKDSQQPESEAWADSTTDIINRRYYQSSSGMRTNYTLFNACMNSHGFYWKVLEAVQ